MMFFNKVLVVDNEIHLLEGLLNELRERNYIVHASETVISGINKVIYSDFDLVFLDYDFGSGMNGIDMLDKIYLIKINIPIIMLSANDIALGTARKKYPDLVIDELEKPYRKHDIDRVLRSYTQWRKSNEISCLSTPVAILKEKLEYRDSFYKKLTFLGNFYEGIISHIASIALIIIRHYEREFIPSIISKSRSKNLTMGDYACVANECLKKINSCEDCKGGIGRLFEGFFINKKGFSPLYYYLFEECIQMRLYLGGHYSPPVEEVKCEQIYNDALAEFNNLLYPLWGLFTLSLWMPEIMKQKDGKPLYMGREFRGGDIRKTISMVEMPPNRDLFLPDNHEGKLFIHDRIKMMYIECDPFMKVFPSKAHEFNCVPFVFKNTDFINDDNVKNYKDYSYFDVDFYN